MVCDKMHNEWYKINKVKIIFRLDVKRKYLTERARFAIIMKYQFAVVERKRCLWQRI